MNTSACSDFDFEYWRRLAVDDPNGFEAERSRVVEALIERASPEIRRRMRGLQWRIDRLRERAPNPMAACVKLTGLMWDAVLGKDGLVETMQKIGACEAAASKTIPTATVIAFPGKRPPAPVESDGA